MEKKAVIEFFDRCAPWWDSDMIRNEDIISTILTLGGIRKDTHVLDWPAAPVCCFRIISPGA